MTSELMRVPTSAGPLSYRPMHLAEVLETRHALVDEGREGTCYAQRGLEDVPGTKGGICLTIICIHNGWFILPSSTISSWPRLVYPLPSLSKRRVSSTVYNRLIRAACNLKYKDIELIY